MNNLSTLLGILQDSDISISTMPTYVYSEKYTIQMVSARTQRRLCVRERNGNSNAMIDMFVGPGVGVVKYGAEYGLQHYSRTHIEPTYSGWYQLFLPSTEIKSVKYTILEGFDEADAYVLDLHNEEDIFQKSTIIDVNFDIINSLIQESTELPPYIASTEKLLILIAGYDELDFKEILEALNV